MHAPRCLEGCQTSLQPVTCYYPCPWPCQQMFAWCCLPLVQQDTRARGLSLGASGVGPLPAVSAGRAVPAPQPRAAQVSRPSPPSAALPQLGPPALQGRGAGWELCTLQGQESWPGGIVHGRFHELLWVAALMLATHGRAQSTLALGSCGTSANGPNTESFVLHLSSGLCPAHAACRDLKPQNIMLTKKGAQPGCLLKIVDLGVSAELALVFTNIQVSRRLALPSSWPPARGVLPVDEPGSRAAAEHLSRLRC